MVVLLVVGSVVPKVVLLVAESAARKVVLLAVPTVVL